MNNMIKKLKEDHQSEINYKDEQIQLQIDDMQNQIAQINKQKDNSVS